ncbi:DUF1612 domain-containing protein [Rhizobium leguminosarum]|uniref:DUF1612 domain-containing protein n=1 Tax=Rhizobium ruizarguesonis TaxID=2081791 RepID=A0AAE4YZN8_9HYPH|nr:DUF1612 domain-containing protein [Rhizobium ruizarguesonis]
MAAPRTLVPTRLRSEQKRGDRNDGATALDFDAVLARSEAAIRKRRCPTASIPRKGPAGTNAWKCARGGPEGQDLPAALQAIVALDAWNELAVSRHAAWLGRLLSASILRQVGVAPAPHLAAFNRGLKFIPVDALASGSRDFT